MKFGVADYGMNVWYGGNWDLKGRLEDLKSIGMDGIERLNCVDAADAVYKAVEFRRMGMDFATVECGQNRGFGMELTAAFGKEYVWLSPGDVSRNVPFDVFCRRANAFVNAAAKLGLKAALHNHLGNRIQDQSEIFDFMNAVPGAYLLLDIGHVHGAGGDNVEIIHAFHDRLAAVHFKDVFIKDESIGLDNWGQRLRFCELGAGNSGFDVEAVGDALKKYNYDKWALIEHDTHLRDPLIDLKTSLDVLKGIFK